MKMLKTQGSLPLIKREGLITHKAFVQVQAVKSQEGEEDGQEKERG
jgi:hypothetical protein